MKIAIIGSGSQSPELPAHLRSQTTGRHVELELIQPRLSLFAFTAYERLIVDVGYVDACQQAAAQGADVVLINSFADYGIAAARAAVTIPVYGAGEAALMAAEKHGSPFGIITVWPRSMGFLYTERLRSLAYENLCCGVRHVQEEDELERLAAESGVMQRMARHDSSYVDLLLQHCDRMIAEGARSIVLGCTCMGPIAHLLAQACRVPIIEGSMAGLKAAMQGQQTPLTEGERTRRPDLIPALVSGWPDMHRPISTSDCPVCIVTESET
jgi:allantoin racemase